MDWLRVKIGLIDPPPPASPVGQQQQAATAANHDSARLIRNLEVQIAALRDEDSELDARAQDAAAKGERATLTRLIQRRKAVAAELAECEGKLANQRSISATLSKADANREQARLMRDAEARLAVANKDADRMNISGIVDDYRDAAAETYDNSQLLSEPLNASLHPLQDPEELDAEVEAMMQRAADTRRLEMPDTTAAPLAATAAASPITPAATASGATAMQQRRAAQMGK